ncbi:hypothetical protein H8959_007237 [Pygathrix nigripes]
MSQAPASNVGHLALPSSRPLAGQEQLPLPAALLPLFRGCGLSRHHLPQRGKKRATELPAAGSRLQRVVGGFLRQTGTATAHRHKKILKRPDYTLQHALYTEIGLHSVGDGGAVRLRLFLETAGTAAIRKLLVTVPAFEELGRVAHSGTTAQKQQEAFPVLDEKPQSRFPFGLHGGKGEEPREKNSRGRAAGSLLHRVILAIRFKVTDTAGTLVSSEEVTETTKEDRKGESEIEGLIPRAPHCITPCAELKGECVPIMLKLSYDSEQTDEDKSYEIVTRGCLG